MNDLTLGEEETITASFVSLWMRRNRAAEGLPICSSDG